MSLVSSRVLPVQAFGVRYAGYAARPLRGEEAIRRAVLLTFQDPFVENCSELRGLSASQWRRLAHWLDLSGLALYFFDRVLELGWHDLLPAQLAARLQQNLIDNSVRTRSMISESIGIQQEFQEFGVQYAVLKGLSLWPNSVPKPELRSQFDLDFLVAEEDAATARKLLERRGYRLYAISGRSWEFKRNERPGISVRDMYKDCQSWVVELHIEPRTSVARSQLARRQWRKLAGFEMPVLSPVDLFIGQGLHVYKHVCGEYIRAAHLEEFRRHVLSRQQDADFWNQVQGVAASEPGIGIKLGIVTLLGSHVMGEFAPEALTSWTFALLPSAVHMWVRMYGNGAVLGSFPGSKRSLLLQKSLEHSGGGDQQRPRKALIPSQLPPPIIRASPNEKMRTRIARNWMQLKFILHRMQFHLVWGFDYLWELRRWRRLMKQAAS